MLTVKVTKDFVLLQCLVSWLPVWYRSQTGIYLPKSIVKLTQQCRRQGQHSLTEGQPGENLLQAES